MNIAYMYRLYPTQKQKELFVKTFGCCRKVWNLMLEEHEDRYKNNDKKAVTPAFFKSEYPYLREVDSSALANVQRNLENEFKQFFQKKKKYPKYKSKKFTRKSYTASCTNASIKILPQINRIQLPKVGKVKAVLHRLPKDEWIIKSATVSQNAIGDFYVSILFEYSDNFKAAVNKEILALDYKSSGLYVDSNNTHEDMPHFYRNSEKKLAKAQHKLSKKKLHSNNWYKQSKRVNKIYVKASNQRIDFLHKQSRKIANSYSFVIVEDLDMKAISRSLKLAKSTLDNGFGMFRNMLSYKLEQNGGALIKVDKWYPSTKTCSVCGNIKKIPLSQRIYKCECCGLEIDRDYNAALNLLKEGKRILGQELPDVKPVETKLDSYSLGLEHLSVKQEARSFMAE